MILVIGNGESRKDVNLNKINMQKVGCNAIYRDFFVDHLICVDKRMANEAIQHKYNFTSKIYTRHDWYSHFDENKNIRIVPDLPFTGYERWDLPWHWGAGPYAVLLATKYSNNINLLGFDLYSKDQFTNNIYKDTDNYNVATKRAVDPSYWIHQIGRLFEHFSDKQFTIFQEQDWQLPKEWKNSNVKVDIIQKLYYN